MAGSDGFDIGFDFDPMALAVSQFVDVARDVGDIQARAERSIESTLKGNRERIAPLVAKASSGVESELRQIEGDVRAISASIPVAPAELRVAGKGSDAPRMPPPVAEPLPPMPPMPPVVQPGGQAWVVMTQEICGPDAFLTRNTLTLQYVNGQPVNPPAGYLVGPVFNSRFDADNWAKQWIAANPRTPCGEPKQPPSEPPPTSLPPLTCPPPSCIPTCPAPEPEPKKLEYCVWVRDEPLDCIVLSADQKEPPDKGYRRTSCHYTKDEADEAAAATCDLKRLADQIQAGYTTPTATFSFCNSELWSKANVLADLTRISSQFASDVIREVPPSEIADIGAQNLMGWLKSFATLTGGAGYAAEALKNIGDSLFKPGAQLAKSIGCNSPEYYDIAFANMVLSVLQKWIGTLPPAVSANLQYSEAFQCPWLIPSAGETQQLYLSGVIDEQTAVNLGRFNGRCDDTTRALLFAGQTRLDPLQTISAYWRGIWDRGRAQAELRARGYTAEDSFETLERTARFVPGPSDIVRFLVRDVADLRIIDEFQLDAEFGDKFDRGDEQIRKQATAQGIDRETLLYYWRAHWTIPSPTQLGEFYRRLRPAEPVDPVRAGRIGLTGEIPDWSPRSKPELNVTAEQVDTALGQQDILPFWRDKFTAVQFLPLTRVDARRAYEIGVIGVDDVYESLIQDGYREADALTLTEYAVKDKQLGIRNSEPAKLFSLGLQSEDETRAELTDLGFLESAIDNFLTREIRARMRSARSLPEFAEFVSGNLDEPDLRIALEDRFYRPDQVDELIATAKRLGKARFRSACTEALKTRFLWGEIDADAAKKELRGFGWSVWAADEIVAGWECALAVSDRLPTVRQLMGWLELGVIGVDDFRERMRRLRFSADDTDRFLAQAIEQQRVKAGKAVDKAIRDQQAQLAKDRAAAARAEARIAKAGRDKLKAVQAARTLAERLALAISQAAIKWAKFAGTSYDEASELLRGFVTLLQETEQLESSTATKIVIQSVEWAIANSESDLATVVELTAIEVDRTADALESSE